MTEFDMAKKFIAGSKILINKEHADKVIATKGNRKLVYESVLEPNTGDAFLVKAGQVIRLEQRDGIGQIVDWLFITPDLKEHSSSGNSTPFQGFYLRQYYHVISSTRAMRPLAVMVADETPKDFAPEGYNPHFWHYHCSPEWHQMASPESPAEFNSCHMNFVQGLNRIPAIHEIKDKEERKQIVNLLACNNNFQTFQPILYFHNDEGQLTQKLGPGGPVPKGTGVEFYVATDLYVVLSVCPFVDQSGDIYGENAIKPVPQYISVWDTGIKPLEPPKWKDWEGAFYEMVDKGEKDISPRTSQDSYK